MAKVIESIYKKLIAGARKLELNEEELKSRITFKNAHRVAALELRKNFVLIHLPKREKLTDIIQTTTENDQEVDHIKSFRATYDSRTWSYIRVSNADEVKEALEVIAYAKEHN